MEQVNFTEAIFGGIPCQHLFFAQGGPAIVVGFPSEHDSTPPSGLIGLHKKLDMLVSHDTEHTYTMEEMKYENAALKDHLCSIKEEMKTHCDLCTVSSSSSTPRSQVKIPPVVFVSLAGKVYVSC